MTYEYDSLHYLSVPLARIGECDACIGRYPHAWCCSDQSLIELNTGVLDPDTEEFLKARGIDVGGDHRARFTIRQMCVQYDVASKKCKDYEHRPKTCRDFPVHPAQVYLGRTLKYCSYDWDLDTERDIEVDIIRLLTVMERAGGGQ